MDKRNLFLDTNVLVQDHKCIYKLGANDLYIPFIVINELDALKKGNSSVSQAARQVSRELDELRSKGKLHEGVELSTGGTLKVVMGATRPKFLLPNEQLNNDHLILQTILDLQEKTGKVFTLITEDINLRLLADVLDISVERYQNTAVNDVSFYDSVKTYTTSKSVIDCLYAYNDLKVFDAPWDNLYDNEYAVLKTANNQSALVKYFDDSLHIVKRSSVYGISPKNKEQNFAMDALLNPDVSLVVLSGLAGSGKTLISLAAGLHQVTEENLYDKVTVARPIVSMGNELGFTPGSIQEKLDPWMKPIYDNLDILMPNAVQGMRGKSGFEELAFQNIIDVEALTYIRGRSIPNQFVIIDEAQNLSPHEVKTIITRAGQGTKLVLTGDPYQIDNPYLDTYNNGLTYVIDRMRGEKCFANITLHKGERSHLAELAANKL